MLNDGLTDVRSQAVDEVEDTGGEVNALHDDSEVVCCQRGQLGWFCDDGVPHQQGWGHFPGEQVQR